MQCSITGCPGTYEDDSAEYNHLPNRWQEQIDKIGERLFLRIGELIQVFGLPPEHDASDVFLPVLERCLYYLAERNQGIQPFAFAMTWWLAALITHEVEPLIQNPSHRAPQLSALLQEVSAWSESMSTLPEYEASGHSQYHTSARSLLRFVQE